MTNKEFKCGATGKVCKCKRNEDGSFPCGKCQVGIEFKKQWKNQPRMHDEF